MKRLTGQAEANPQPFWDTDHAFPYDIFADNLIVGSDGSLVPPPQTPGPLQTPPIALSQQLVTYQRQFFSAGSLTIGQGILVQTDYQTSYLDHGRNLLTKQ
jgi:hypothetical protein